MINNEIRYWRSVTVKPTFPLNAVWESLFSVDDWKYIQDKLRLHFLRCDTMCQKQGTWTLLHQVLRQCWCLSTRKHNITFQKNITLTFPTVRISKFKVKLKQSGHVISQTKFSFNQLQKYSVIWIMQKSYSVIILQEQNENWYSVFKT